MNKLEQIEEEILKSEQELIYIRHMIEEKILNVNDLQEL